MKNVLTLLLVILLASCSRDNGFYVWTYETGEKVPVLNLIYQVTDSNIKQSFTYESSFEYFEVDLNKMNGKYLTKGIPKFSNDSLLVVNRITCSICPAKWELFRLSYGYSDDTYDNECDFYLEKSLGVILVKSYFKKRKLVKVK